MEGGSKPMLDAKKIAEQWPKFQDKEKVSIGENWVWEIVVAYYHIYYNFYKPRYVNGDLN